MLVDFALCPDSKVSQYCNPDKTFYSVFSIVLSIYYHTLDSTSLFGVCPSQGSDPRRYRSAR